MSNLVKTIDDMIDQLDVFAEDIERVAREAETESRRVIQAGVGNVQGIRQEIT